MRDEREMCEIKKTVLLKEDYRTRSNTRVDCNLVLHGGMQTLIRERLIFTL